jgi:3-oxoacyl-[acyl-carrier protein] reductase
MPDSEFLKGRRAVVTGGGRGIGRAIAHALARAGAEVIICSRNRNVLEETATEILASGGSAKAFACDISDESQVLDLFAFAEAQGGADILINNAGIGIFKPLRETTADEWDAMMAVNLRGAFLCGREAMKQMARGGGRIINIGSVVSVKGYPEQGGYTASKHGLLGLSRVMALEGQEEGIITQIICPGGVDTPMVGESRPDLDRSVLMKPEEIAEAVLFCLQQEGSAITDFVPLRRRHSTPFSSC